MPVKKHCPLCDCEHVTCYHEDARREYWRCSNCALIFVPPRFYLDREAEKAEYDLHRNAVDDAGYRQFLSRLASPLLQRLPAGARGLDFGCGPAPALADLLRERGCEVALYDPFYAPQHSLLDTRYDFICATEVVEHLHQPGRELQRLWSILQPEGWLAVMTKLVKSREAFATWHYKRDPTHVCFFSDTTWQWWAQEFDARIERYGADVIMLQRLRC